MALYRSGPDPRFPVLNEYERFVFQWDADNDTNIIAVGGNLAPGLLLSAYEQGIFPWYNDGDPILWQSPDPRFVLFKDNLHISKSMKKILRQGKFEIRFDTNFESVIRNCATRERRGQDGTWITKDMIKAYIKMHELGWAHSAESYIDGKLVGGCYGVRLGNAFFGESMFSFVSNASKAAFLTLAQILIDDGVIFIDSQAYTNYLESLGAIEIPRAEYLEQLRLALEPRQIPTDANHPAFRRHEAIDKADRRGKWTALYQSN
ncbi:MAG: leucyl/phenylalanyl-tRNA--protein transferase [Treponema sp.]|nr:leucyl/phenylalanyl-tRNA--protein transferase [Treponema sp.]